MTIQLGRSPSTVSREINHNGGYHDYRAAKAEQAAWDRAKRPKLCKLAGIKLMAMINKGQMKKNIVSSLSPADVFHVR